MKGRGLRIVVLGLTISSSWGNGHATTYRALLKGLAERGHDVLFLEREQPWYAAYRDLTEPDYCQLAFYHDLAGLRAWRGRIAAADAVIVGSFVPDGIAVGKLVQAWATGTTAFYDIDTPVTLARLSRGSCDYLSPELVPGFDLYLSFTGGPTLQDLASRLKARRPRPLYCSVDAGIYRPLSGAPRYDLGYLGTYSPDRQPVLERLLLEPARRAPDLRFVVAGPLYPSDLRWPPNVERIEHVPPPEHPAFYTSCRYSLNVTRGDMARAGFSPSVRLFEAGACGVPVISDSWPGLETFFAPGTSIATVASAEAVLGILQSWSEERRRAVGRAARRAVLDAHTARHRALDLEREIEAVLRRKDELTRARETQRESRNKRAAPTVVQRPVGGVS